MTTAQLTRIGKTTVATCVGLSFAQVRPGDRVVAINADTAFGTLGARVDTAPRSPDLLQHRLVAHHGRTLGDGQRGGENEYCTPLFVATKVEAAPISIGSSISTDDPFCRPKPL
jgi:hypothetical protein